MPEVETPTPAVPDAPRRRGRPPKTDASDSGRRLALIAAAARHFRDRGFDATTTRDIASATGMQSGSPFYHFKSKQDLLCAIMEEGMLAAQRSQDAVLAALPPGTGARDTLAALVLNHLYVLWLPGNDFVPVMHYEWRSLAPEHHQRVQVLKDAYELPWQAALEQLAAERRLGTDASLARSMLFGVLHGTMRWFKPTGCSSRIEREVGAAGRDEMRGARRSDGRSHREDEQRSRSPDSADAHVAPIREEHPKGKLKLEQLARECLNAMVAEWPHGTAAPAAARTPQTAFDPVPLVRRVWRQLGAGRLGPVNAQRTTPNA